jgi:hypothetical protein
MKMNTEQLTERINDCIEEEFGGDKDMFVGEDVETVTDILISEYAIEWELLSVLGDFRAAKEGHNSFGWYFYFIENNDDEISREDFIDLILKIEAKYQEIKDKVAFNG